MQRLLAVSKYRMFTFSKAFSGFKLEEDYPLLRISEIGAASGGALLYFKVADAARLIYFTVQTTEGRALIKVVRERYRQFSWGWPGHACAQITIPETLLEPLDPNFKKDVAGGFAHTY